MSDNRTDILIVLQNKCPTCGGDLDTGYECNSCGFDGLPLIQRREACELRGDRMHSSCLYSGEMVQP